MNIGDILSDAFQYPLSDFKQLLKLGLPYLVLAIFTIILNFAIDNSSSTTIIVLASLINVMSIVATLIMWGIGLSIIRETIKSNNQLPELDIKNNFIDGIKYAVVGMVYLVIPIVIMIIGALLLVLLARNGAIIGAVLIIIGVILAICLSLLLTVAVCKLAETDDFGEVFNFKQVYAISKRIGLGKIFGIIIVTGILIAILSMLLSIFTVIPVIGTLIINYIFFTYTILLTHRMYGLLYSGNQYEVNNNLNQQNPVNMIQDYQQKDMNNNIDFNGTNPVNDSRKIDMNPKENVESDFEETKKDLNDENEVATKKCSKCGHNNPDFVNVCVNCGSEL